MEKKSSSDIFRINKDFIIPENNKTTFQSIFSYLRKKLQVKYTRKSHIDSLLKKSKGKFFKAVHESLKICLNIIIKRLPQKFITNITIEYNQKFLNKTIIEIYREFNILPSLDEIFTKNLCNVDKIDYLKEILNSNFYNLYETYTESERFKRDINEVRTHEGKRNGLLYEFVANNFCIYYLYGKAHIQKEKKKIIINKNELNDEDKNFENEEEKTFYNLSSSSSKILINKTSINFYNNNINDKNVNDE